MRENAFNLIGPVDDAAVLDLYAGSGALGLEALSRGAASCVFVETDRDACRTIDANLEKLRPARAACSARTRRARSRRSAARSTWSSAIRRTTRAAHDRLAPHLAAAARARTALLVYESLGRATTRRPFAGLEVRTSRKYGSARLTLFEH